MRSLPVRRLAAETPLASGVRPSGVADVATRHGNLAAVLRFIKVEHSVFALPFVYVGILVAPVPLSPSTFLFATTAAVGARGAAMVANRIIDRRIDAANPRTADRDLPAGRISLPLAWGLLVAFLALFFVSAAALNPLVLALSPLVVPPLVLYPYFKRFTPLCHFMLGLTLGIAPAGGYLAATGSFAGFGTALLLSLSVAAWVTGFDLLYALLDVAFDRVHGVRSIPADWGVTPALGLSFILHLLTVLLLAAAGWTADLGPLWFFGVAVVGGLLVTEHLVVEPDDPRSINLAFFTLNGLTSLVLFLFALGARLWTPGGASL